MDSIMVQGDHEDRFFLKGMFITICFQGRGPFLKFNVAIVKCGTSAKRTVEKSNEAEYMNEYGFMQYYNVLSKNIVSLDKIDKTLRCITLMWQRENEVEEELPAGRSFGLLTAGSIRGRIHVL